ncbi:Rib/alpha-like domain-containing protein [Blautia hansenii]|uniref:YSIRK-type signal peptide-containing protein n=1 Tax=Blautia hansenii TaxID=1322 RepID=A0ABX2I818_BLAHA|nr:Rib/alpha-like domain-containing protein [Blautia hansenii]MCB5600735.1 YSIRK-type signal peptide-containing protein [Blautia hansenii]NSJ86299.1 YSIRK-type signal peptide-containing protein [Blautia hansenii]
MMKRQRKRNGSMPAEGKQRWSLRKLSIGVCSVLLGFTVFMPGAVSADTGVFYTTGDKAIDLETHYTATGIEDSNLRYAATVYDKVDENGNILLTMTKWAVGSTGWGTDKDNEFAGQYMLSFSNDDFYKQIDRVTLGDVSLEKQADGALWKMPITKISRYALIGVVTNHEIKITLKNGQTLESLGLADKEISFSSVWTKQNGKIASESVSSGYILQNNSHIKNEKKTGFTAGRMTQKILFQADSMSIKSIHTFKPNENYLQSDYQWVVYIKEQIPEELLKYIDTNNIEIFNSDLKGVKSNNRQAFKLSIDDTGLVDTSRTPELSIIGNDTRTQLTAARNNTNDIFWGTLGQSRNYTIEYKLKENVTMAEFAKAMNDYIAEKNERVLFDHWMEADYLDTAGSKADGGQPPQQLENSYSNAYLDTNDTDKDGIFDFVEWEIGTDVKMVDTDGDGVPDGKEFVEDNTSPLKASDYLVSVPKTDKKKYDTDTKSIIEGTVPKPLLTDPSNPDRLLRVTNAEAGGVIVKLLKYDETTQTPGNKEYASVKIPYEDLEAGKFSMEIQANTVPEGTKAILVAYSPNGKNAVAGDILEFVTVADAEKYEAKGQDIQAELNSQPKAESAIANKGDLPKNSQYDWKIPVDTSAEGEKTGTVVVTYPDGSQDEVEVKITVTDSRSDAEKYEAKGKDIQAELNSQPEAESAIANKADLPKNTNYDWKTPIDTSSEGEKTGTVVITYPDGSQDEIEVKVTVTDSRTDAGKYEAEGGILEKPYGEPATEKEVLSKVTTNAPAEKIQSMLVTGAIPGTGQNKPVEVTVTYADGSVDTVTVMVSYGSAADLYEPEGQPIIADKGSQPSASDAIANKDELPPETSYEWENPVDTSVPGTVPGTILVTYPDGSKDTVRVDITVNETATDTEQYEAEGGTLEKPYGEPATEEEVLSKVTTNAPAEKIQSILVTGTIPGAGQNKPVEVTVTYADGSVDTVTVMVSYGSAADLYEPEGQPITTDKGNQPSASDAVANKDELPPETSYEWQSPVDTSVPGTVPGTILVTYPDGSKDTVIVEITIKETASSQTDAQKYTPQGQSVTVEMGKDVSAAEAIKNKEELPQDTKYQWENAVDTSKPGKITGTVVVIYPDGSTEKVSTEITVTDTRTDAEKYDPITKPEVIKPGEKPDLTDNITNIKDLPQGTEIKDVTPEGAIDIHTPGEYTGTLEILYPDGSKETVTTKVTVEKSKAVAGKTEYKAPTPKGTDTNGNSGRKTKGIVKTGDEAPTAVYAGLLGSALTLFGMVSAKAKKRKHKTDR